MDGWLKVLVAAACVVVIAVGTLYAYRDNQAAASAEAAEKERVMRSACRQAAENRASLSAMYDHCVENGYI